MLRNCPRERERERRQAEQASSSLGVLLAKSRVGLLETGADRVLGSVLKAASACAGSGSASSGCTLAPQCCFREDEEAQLSATAWWRESMAKPLPGQCASC